MNIGDKVKTNDFYMDYYNWLIKKTPIEIGTIADIKQIDDHMIINVKLKNGRYREINEKFLEVI